MARTKSNATKQPTTTTTTVVKSKAPAPVKVPRGTTATKMVQVVAPTPTILKKKRRVRAGTKAGREVKKLQSTTNLLLMKAPVKRVIRELLDAYTAGNDGKPLLVQKSAFEALQESGEALLVRVYGKASIFMKHAGRKTIMSPDLSLAIHEIGLGKTVD